MPTRDDYTDRSQNNIAKVYAKHFSHLLKPIALALVAGDDVLITEVIEDNKSDFITACIEADKAMPRSFWTRCGANLVTILIPVFGIIAILGKTAYSYYKASQTGLTGKLGVFGASTEQEQVESLKEIWQKNFEETKTPPDPNPKNSHKP